MAKTARKILLIFCSFVLAACLGAVGLLWLNTNKSVVAKAASEPTVTFSKVFETQNNAAWEANGGFNATYLVFEGGEFTPGTGHSTTGIYYTNADGTQGSISFLTWVTEGGSGAPNGENADTHTIQLLYQGTIADNCVLHVDGGTEFAGQVLPEVTLYMVNGKWQAPVTFEGVVERNYDDWQNNSGFFATYLQFSGAFTPGLYDGISTTGIYYTDENGKNGKSFGFLWVQEGGQNGPDQTAYMINAMVKGDIISNGSILHIEKNTEFAGQVLPEVTLYMVDGNWQKEKPVVEPTVTFTGVDANQNNVQWGTGQYIGVFLNFSADFTAHNDKISTITYTPDGGTATSFDFTWANFGGLGAPNQLQLLITGLTPIADGAVLHIEKNTEIGGQVLPEVTLYMVNGKWQKEEPVVEPTVTFVEVDENQNNVQWGTGQYIGVFLTFDKDFTAHSDLVSTITYTPAGGTATSFNYTWANFGSLGSANQLQLLINGLTPIADGAVLHIEKNTVIGGQVLPEVTLYMVNGKWQKDKPVISATFTGIGTHNNAHWNGNPGFAALDLVFSVDFEKDQAGNAGIYYTVPGDDTPHTFGFVWANAGSADANVIQLLDSKEASAELSTCYPDGAVLHIAEGTVVGGQRLPEVTLYYNAASCQWQTDPYVSGFTAVEGASIRIDRENGGLRFETHIEEATYDSLVATYGKANIKFGTYILPAAWLSLSGKSLHDYVTMYTAADGYYLDISTWNAEKGENGFANSDSTGNITDGNTYYKYYGTISKVKYENYLESFIGVGYLWVTDENGENLLYLTHDGSWSRNVYEIAKAAYQDTTNVRDSQLYGVTPYFDKVIAISISETKENTLIYDIDSVLAARPSYSYTKPTDYTVKVENGVITAVSTSNTVYNVMINGEKAGVIKANGTAYADYYAVDAKLFDSAEEAGAINFGIGEPTQELWGQSAVDGFNKTFGTTNLNTGSTATNIAKVNKEYNGNTARIWFQIADVCWPNDLASFAFIDGSINAIQGVVDDFREQGVANIALMSGVANYRSTTNYYKDSTWYSFWDTLEGGTGVGATPYPNLIVLPNESDYQDFLALQKEYFKQIALNVNGITTIEILNELETSILNQTRFGIANGYAPDIKLVAQAAMDICKAATDGVKEAGKNIKIMMPALCCVNEIKSGANVTRYNSVKLLEAEYAYIMGENGTKNADDYFQIINIHPYVSISSDTSNVNYLYYEDNGLKLQTPTQIKERWVAYMNSLRTIFVKNGDAEKPVWITEFGIADYESCNNTPLGAGKWSDYRDNKVLRQAQVFQIVYDAIKEMPYIDSVIFFRLGDYEHTEHNYADCGEATYGMIDQNGALKDIGKYMYAIVNGVNVFTDDSYGTLKELSANGFGDFYAQITAFESAVEGIY